MAYVLEYTVTPARGEPQVVNATSHANALAEFLADPLALITSNHAGTYLAEPGEEITVVGYVEREWAHRSYWESAVARTQRDLAGAPEKATRSKHSRRQVQKHLDELLANEAPEAREHAVVFRIGRKTLQTMEYVSGLPAKQEEAA